jgi:hypothetical protein
LQRGGRGGRNKTGQAIFLIMYEPWVKDINLSALDFTPSDPDHPNVAKLSKTSKKQERTGIAMIKILQCDDCLRDMFAQYLADDTPEGKLSNNLWKCIHQMMYSFKTYYSMLLQSPFGLRLPRSALLQWPFALPRYAD